MLLLLNSVAIMMILLGKVFFLLSLEKIKFALKIKSKIINES